MLLTKTPKIPNQFYNLGCKAVSQTAHHFCCQAWHWWQCDLNCSPFLLSGMTVCLKLLTIFVVRQDSVTQTAHHFCCQAWQCDRPREVWKTLGRPNFLSERHPTNFCRKTQTSFRASDWRKSRLYAPPRKKIKVKNTVGIRLTVLRLQETSS